MSKFNNPPGFDSIRPGQSIGTVGVVGRGHPKLQPITMSNVEAIKILENIETDIYGRIAIRKAIDALSRPWVKTADRLPTKDDEGVYGAIVAFNPVLLDGEYGACTCIPAKIVIDYPDWWIKWMPIPPLPEDVRT